MKSRRAKDRLPRKVDVVFRYAIDKLGIGVMRATERPIGTALRTRFCYLSNISKYQQERKPRHCKSIPCKTG